MKKSFNRLVSVLSVALFLTVSVSAQTLDRQTPQNSAANPKISREATEAAAIQNLVGQLGVLPAADTLIFLNTQRILNEVVPKFMSPKDVEGMRMAFDDVKKNAGVDPRNVDYVVMAVRFRKPTSDLNFQPPEFLVVSGGDLSAESLMLLAQGVAPGKMREETHGSRKLSLVTIDPLVKEAEKNPLLRSFTEMGMASLNASTIAFGSPAYLRAALDAADGKERIDVETLNSLVRDPNALISIAGKPWHSFSKSIGLLGTEGNPRAPRCESRFGDFYAALTMDTTNFMLRGALNQDNPDTARIVSNLLGMFLKGAAGQIKDPGQKSLINSIAINAEGDEVTLRADFPQQMVLNVIKKQMQPKQAAPSVSAPAKKPTTRRRARSRS